MLAFLGAQILPEGGHPARIAWYPRVDEVHLEELRGLALQSESNSNKKLANVVGCFSS